MTKVFQATTNDRALASALTQFIRLAYRPDSSSGIAGLVAQIAPILGISAERACDFLIGDLVADVQVHRNGAIIVQFTDFTLLTRNVQREWRVVPYEGSMPDTV